jgi:hypothetical protein
VSTLPRYPVYVISKGRADCCYTAAFLKSDGVPYRVVVEPQEQADYAKHLGADRLLCLPFSNLGLGSIPARNWCWEHAKADGFGRHWILDDNIRGIYRRFRAYRMYCESGPAFACTEDFVDRYENVGLAGLNYQMFAPDRQKLPPFYLNVHVYSCLLIDNGLPYRWRGRYNEDTDLCLQVLSGGLCTVAMNIFLTIKQRTMTMKGGNSAELYKGDGRLRMARALERMWPGVVEVKRRFKRPQHVIKYAWQRFDTPLRLKPGIDLEKLAPNEYGMKLKQVASAVQSKWIRGILEEQAAGGAAPAAEDPKV